MYVQRTTLNAGTVVTPALPKATPRAGLHSNRGVGRFFFFPLPSPNSKSDSPVYYLRGWVIATGIFLVVALFLWWVS